MYAYINKQPRKTRGVLGGVPPQNFLDTLRLLLGPFLDKSRAVVATISANFWLSQRRNKQNWSGQARCSEVDVAVLCAKAVRADGYLSVAHFACTTVNGGVCSPRKILQIRCSESPSEATFGLKRHCSYCYLCVFVRRAKGPHSCAAIMLRDSRLVGPDNRVTLSSCSGVNL